MQQPLIGQELMRGSTGRLFERLGKVEEAHAGGRGDILQRHFDLQVGNDVVLRPLELPGAIAYARSLRWRWARLE